MKRTANDLQRIADYALLRALKSGSVRATEWWVDVMTAADEAMRRLKHGA